MGIFIFYKVNIKVEKRLSILGGLLSQKENVSVFFMLKSKMEKTKLTWLFA